MNITGDSRKGGRGQCRFCGEWYGNVAYHEAWECKSNPRDLMNPQVDESLLGLIYGKSLDAIVEETHECTYDADGASCPKCGKSSIEHPTLTQTSIPSNEGLKLCCDTCLKLLIKPGALVFSPPSDGTPMTVTKHHICIECYELLADIMKLPYNFPRKPIE